jgi:hypothetical protein
VALSLRKNKSCNFCAGKISDNPDSFVKQDFRAGLPNFLVAH